MGGAFIWIGMGGTAKCIHHRKEAPCAHTLQLQVMDPKGLSGRHFALPYSSDSCIFDFRVVFGSILFNDTHGAVHL